MASSKSSALPCGMPSTTSMSTTSASSFDAIQWAAVAPTLPAPTMLTFFLISILLGVSNLHLVADSHVSDDARRKLARAHLGCAGGLAFKIIRDEFLLDGLL